VEIYFSSKQLQKKCNKQQEMVRAFGSRMAKKLQQRLMELRAAASLHEISHLPPPRLHELSGNRAGQFSVDLVHPYRLLFIVANDPVPWMPDGTIERERVTKIEIVEIEDTH